MTLAGRAGSIIGAIGLVSAALIITNYFYAGFRNINERLTGIGFKVLDVNNDSDWVDIEAEYKKSENESRRFQGVLLTARDNCIITLQANPNDPNYKLASRWCVKPEKIDEMLSRNKYKKIEKSLENNENKTKWKKKLESLNKYGEKKKFVIGWKSVKENEQVKELEKECTKMINEKVITYNDDRFEEKYLQAREWCAEKTDSKQ